MNTASPPAGPSTATTSQVVAFQLAGQTYAFRIERIQEIITPGKVTVIPEVPAYVAGVGNLRGTIIPIVNLRLLFGHPDRPLDAASRTIVVNVGPRVMGCTVDSVTQVMRIAADQIHPAPEAVAAGGPRYIEGFVRVHEDLVILLDVGNLLDPALLEGVHAASLSHAHPPRPPAAPAATEGTP